MRYDQFERRDRLWLLAIWFSLCICSGWLGQWKHWAPPSTFRNTVSVALAVAGACAIWFGWRDRH